MKLRKIHKIGIVFTIVVIGFVAFSFAFEEEFIHMIERNSDSNFETEIDGVQDSISDSQQTVILPYPIPEDEDYPDSYKTSPSGIRLNPPSNLSTEVEYDPKTGEYKVYEKVGAFEVSTPYTMTSDEYFDYISNKNKSDYWRLRANGNRHGDNSAFAPEVGVANKLLDNVFGENVVDIIPQGSIDLTLGLKIYNNDNPALTEEQQTSTNLDFQNKIQMSVTGKVGDKVSLTLKYDTEAQFEFDNQMKLEYEGEEDDIIQKFEAGNVSFPLTTSLITGSQSLFGFRTDLKFGRLKVSGVFSRQEGETNTIVVDGGAQVEEFEIECDDYEKNKHFFLSHYFRQEYENAFRYAPTISNGCSIENVEVWVSQTTITSTIKNSRNIVALSKLGDVKDLINSEKFQLPYKDKIYNDVNSALNGVTDVQKAKSELINMGYKEDIDFKIIENATLMDPSQYTVNRDLGYISFKSAVEAQKVVALSYSYTKKVRVSIGTLSEEATDRSSFLVVKMIKNNNFTPSFVNWDLMMKNVYSLGGYQLSNEDFELNILYKDDKTGTPIPYLPEGNSKGVNLLRVLKCDTLTSDLLHYPDGYYDFIDGYTINAAKGIIYFPVLEPFGDNLRESIGNDAIATKYVYDQLYDSTITNARQVAEKNKFILSGSYKSSVSSVIRLNSTQVEEGSVVVTQGGVTLIEGTDYDVNYSMGEVRITNSSYLESGTPITVTSESNPLFNTKTKTLYGTRLDYRFSENFNLGGTLMHLSETPMAQKVGFEDFPVNNTIWGLDGTYSTKTPILTTLVDKLPLIETKEESSIKISGEFAQLIPGESDKVDDAIEIDYFDNTERSISIGTPSSWVLASIPKGQNLFPESMNTSDRSSGFNRALLAWYDINTAFYRSASTVSDDGQSGHFSRAIYNDNLFPDKDNTDILNQPISIMNIAYYPYHRGPYNYDIRGLAGISLGIDTETGYLKSPETRWAGIMKELNSPDFDESNYEYIEFWLMDPFVEDLNNNLSGGDFYINLGNVSEDILPDGRISVENTLTTNAQQYDETIWGRVSKNDQTSGFSNDVDRSVQDVGFDGLSDDDEKVFYRSFTLELSKYLNNTALASKFEEDPSGDNFYSYDDKRGNPDGDIVWRYKFYNGPDGNSPGGSATGAGQLSPDVEDVNGDENLETSEAYYQYKISLRPQNLVVGENFIVDKRTENVDELPNGESATPVDWYQFKIPIRTENKQAINGIADFTNIQFIRMFLHGFQDSIVLRMAEFNLVKSEWRKFTKPLYEEGDYDIFNDSEFEVSTVNIEENGSRTPVNYVLPPGVSRVIDPMNTTIRQLNEASIQLKVTDLDDGNSKAVYKTVAKDFRQFGTLEMFCHAEAPVGEENIIDDGELRAFIRLGSDYTENYYEYEIPLEFTPHSSDYDNGNGGDRKIVWPDANFFRIDLSRLVDLKKDRNTIVRDGKIYPELDETDRYTIPDPENPNHYMTIKGHPNLSDIETIMIGVKNPKKSSFNSSDDAAAKSAIIWFNELRLTDFNNTGGWAALANAKIDLADFANITLAGKTSKPGFGSVDQQVFDRSQEELYQYDFASTVALNKFLPEQWGVNLPFYYDYSESFINPQYDPLNPDILMEESLDQYETREERDSIKNITQEYTKRKSYNFTNVKINRADSKPSFYNISNFSLTYAYSEYLAHDIKTISDFEYRYRVGFDYNYSGRPKNFEPFKKLKPKQLQIIKDFNFFLAPSQVSFKNQWDREYKENQRRNLNSDVELPVTASKNFDWERKYDVVYNLSKSLKISYSATNIARVDEPYGVIDKENQEEWTQYKEDVWENIKKFGTNDKFNQNVSASYKVPIDKIPLFNWVQSNYKYSGNYEWELGPQFDPDEFGNIPTQGNSIKNSNTHALDNTLSLTKLYNKSKYLKNLSKSVEGGGKKKPASTTVKYNKSDVSLKEKEMIVVNHKLKTSEVKVTFLDSKGKVIDGETVILSSNKIGFTPKQSHENAKVLITGTKKDSDSKFQKVVDATVYMLIMPKTISINWSSSEGSYVPGYSYGTNYFGLNDPFGPSGMQPGLGYVFGAVPNNFDETLENSDWIVNDPINSTERYLNSNTNDLSIKATLQPLKSFRISLNADRKYSQNFSQSLFADDDMQRILNDKNAITDGSFSISINTLASSLNSDAAYEQFRENRLAIAHDLAQQKGENYEIDPETGFPVMYNENSQDVLIPAFIAAYTGESVDEVYTDDYFLPMFSSAKDFLNKINWRVSYTGLSNIKVVKKYLKSLTVNHAYKSTYSIGGYETFGGGSVNDDGTYMDPSDFNVYYAPQFAVNSVSISESLSPLIGLDMKWINDLTSKFEIKSNRNVALSFTNTEIAETYGKEVVIGLGYVFKNFTINIKTQGAKKEYKNDLTVKADFSMRENTTTRRIIADDVTQKVSGNTVYSLKVYGDYMLTERFTIRIYFDLNNNQPVVGYNTTAISFGFNLRFSLMQ